MSEFSIRPGTSSDFEAAVSVWRESDAARRGGNPDPAEREKGARKHIGKPDALFLVADDGSSIVGVACGMPGLADDGTGPRIEGLCHIAMVFVAPERWGEGIGGMLMDATLEEARSRGYERAQLWTHKGNDRATRLYERRGFERSGREKEDDLGGRIVHFERGL